MLFCRKKTKKNSKSHHLALQHFDAADATRGATKATKNETPCRGVSVIIYIAGGRKGEAAERCFGREDFAMSQKSCNFAFRK